MKKILFVTVLLFVISFFANAQENVSRQTVLNKEQLKTYQFTAELTRVGVEHNKANDFQKIEVGVEPVRIYVKKEENRIAPASGIEFKNEELQRISIKQ